MALTQKKVWELNPGDRVWIGYDEGGAVVDRLELVSPIGSKVRIVWNDPADQARVIAEWDRDEILGVYPPDRVKLAKYLVAGDRVVPDYFKKRSKRIEWVQRDANQNVVVKYSGFLNFFKEPDVFEPDQEIDIEVD